MILIVDNDGSNLELIEEILKPHEMHRANSGKQALTLCRMNNYDLIIMNDKMPARSSINTAKQLQNISYDVPILFYTTLTSDIKLVNDMASCSIGCVCKSDAIETLVDKVNLILAVNENKKKIEEYKRQVV